MQDLPNSFIVPILFNFEYWKMSYETYKANIIRIETKSTKFIYEKLNQYMAET